MTERLQKIMATRGMCSRRKAEALIAEGKVFVNGEKVTELGTKVPVDADIRVIGVRTNTAPVPQASNRAPVYILLHKPVGIITSTSSEQGTSVLDLIQPDTYVSRGEKAITAWKQIAHTRIYPVGRLDKDSEGLVLLTNDGDLANTLTHPRYEHEKEYEVTITGRVPKGAEAVLARGMDIGEGEFVKGIQVTRISNRGKRTIVTVILEEGKHRQIRRMFARLGMEIISLKRTRIGRFSLGTLPVGSWIIVQP